MAFERMIGTLAASLLVAGCGDSSLDRGTAGGLAARVPAARLQADEATACGAQVTRRGDDLVVTPGGGEDTAAIQCAIDHASGGTVRLSPGLFRIAQIIAYGFSGSIVGAGPDRTTLTNVDRPIPVTAVGFSDALPSADHPWPSLVNFVNGSFRLRGFTIHVRGTEPTTGWAAFGVQDKALGHVISITGSTVEASIERVEIRGEEAPAEWFGFNALNAIDVESVVGDDPLPLRVKLSIRDCAFASLGSAVPVSNVRYSSVSITGNRFQGTLLASEIVDMADSVYQFVDNDAVTAWATIDQYDIPLGPSSSHGVERTTLLVADNRISGGPVVLEGTLGADVRCRITDNAFEGTPGLDVFLGPGTHDCLVAGTPNVVDLGTGNRIVP